jgi:hypothetical protein
MKRSANSGVATRTGLFVGLLVFLLLGGVAHAAAPSAVVFFEAPPSIDATVAQLLEAQLGDAQKANARLVVRARTDAPNSMTPDALTRLAEPAQRLNLTVLATGKAGPSTGQGAALLYALAATRFTTPGTTLPAVTDPQSKSTLQQLGSCSDACFALVSDGGSPAGAKEVRSAGDLLASLGAGSATPAMYEAQEQGQLDSWFPAEQETTVKATATPVTKNGGGFAWWLPLGLLLALLVLAGSFAGLRRRPVQHVRETPMGDPPKHPTSHKTHRPPPVAEHKPPPPPTGGSRIKATLRTVLDPEGYAEIDGCMQRVRWDHRAGDPPSPGVEVLIVKGRDDRLLAVAGPATGGRQLGRGGDDTGRTRQ